MDWHELSANWHTMKTRLHRRFPALDETRFPHPPRDSAALARHLADTHDLTLSEARDALQDFLRLEGQSHRTRELAGK